MHGDNTVLFKIPPIGPIDLSITGDVLILWIAALVTFSLLFFSCNRRNPVPRGAFQGLFEGLVEMINKEIIGPCVGKDAAHWSGLILALFFFVLSGNLLGMVPYSKSPTSNWNVTAGLAAFVFLTTVYINVRSHGLFGFLKKFRPSGVHPAILPLLIPIEVISWLAKPCSLAIRLFANMMAGHALILAFIGLTAAAAAAWKTSFLAPLPFVGALIMSSFEIFVSFVQAFIFAMLSALYIREALDSAH